MDRDLQRDAEALFHSLSELTRVHQFRDRCCTCNQDLSVTQCYAIGALVRLGRLTLNDLAADLYLDKSTASRVVDALERKGYLKRNPDHRDARALRLEPTAPGRALHAKIEQELIAEQKTLIADFDPEVRQATITLMSKLAHAAAARFKRTSRCPADEEP